GLRLGLLFQILTDPRTEHVQAIEIANALREIVIELGEFGALRLDQPDARSVLPHRAFLLGLRVREEERELVLLARLERADRLLDGFDRLPLAQHDLVRPRGRLALTAKRRDLDDHPIADD